MNDDLIARLRKYSKRLLPCTHEAADALKAQARRIAELEARLNYIENYIEGRIRGHIAIADEAGTSASGKKQRVRASEASEILGIIRKENALAKGGKNVAIS